MLSVDDLSCQMSTMLRNKPLVPVVEINLFNSLVHVFNI